MRTEIFGNVTTGQKNGVTRNASFSKAMYVQMPYVSRKAWDVSVLMTLTDGMLTHSKNVLEPLLWQVQTTSTTIPWIMIVKSFIPTILA
jgi:hypothetical protein